MKWKSVEMVYAIREIRCHELWLSLWIRYKKQVTSALGYWRNSVTLECYPYPDILYPIYHHNYHHWQETTFPEKPSL